jgi:hypothetical protein
MTEDNLIVDFILPLACDGGRYALGRHNLINCYLTQDNVLLCTVEREYWIPRQFYCQPNLIGKLHPSGAECMGGPAFKIPERFEPDVALFREGRYSRMSHEAKGRIAAHSGLLIKDGQSHEELLRNADKLLALSRDARLRLRLEEQLDVRIDPEAELLSPPTTSYFLNIQINNYEQSTS